MLVSAIPSFHHEFLLSERDALPEPSFFNDEIQLELRDAKVSSGLASAVLHDAGHLFKEYGPDVTRAIANNINQQRQQQQQPHRRDPSWESVALHEAGHLVKEYGPDVTRAIANNLNQQRQQNQQNQQQQHKRDPNFFKKLEHGLEGAVQTVAPMALKMLPRDLAERDPSFFKKLEHDADAVAKAVGPLALKYGPKIAGAALMARGIDARDLAERDPNLWQMTKKEPLRFKPAIEPHTALATRDPSFIKSAEHDADKALHAAGNLAYQYGPDIALAVLDHKSSKGKRDLEFALYQRDAEAEADAETFNNALYERNAEVEADVEGLFERDAEPEDFYDELYVRDLGHFDE